MSLSRRARKQLIALGVIIALVLLIGVGGNQLRLARRAASATDGLQRGTAAFEAGNYEEAIVQLNRYVPRNQNDSDAVYMLAKSRLEVPQDGGGHFGTALSFARRAVDNDPDSVRNRLLVVEVLLTSGLGSPGEWLTDIDGVLSLEPSRTDLRRLKVQILSSSDRTDDAIDELRSILRLQPSSLEALRLMANLLADRPAEFNQWVAELDQRAAAENLPAAEAAALDIARIGARIRLIPDNPQQAGASALAATRALGAYDILTQSLLTSTVASPDAFRSALEAVDDVERALRLIRPQNPDQAQATIDRLEAVNSGAMDFVARHTTDPSASPALVLGALEWFWTSDRPESMQDLAARWREAVPVGPISGSTAGPAVAVESLIAMTRALPDDQLAPNLTEIATSEDSTFARGALLWPRLAAASSDLQARRLIQAESSIEKAVEDAQAMSERLTFSADPPAGRAVSSFIATLAGPAIDILAAEIASASGDIARAITRWTQAATQRRAWDLPALKLLEAYRNRGSIGRTEAMSTEAMLRGATLGTGLSIIESRVEQYALGLIPYELASEALSELREAGLPEPPLAVAKLRLAIIGALREPNRSSELASEVTQAIELTIQSASEENTAAETLVRMLRAADELGVLNNPAFVPAALAADASEAIDARFADLAPESKYAASLIEVARTGVYGSALERLTAEVRRIEDDTESSEAARFDHQRILARFTSELARSYQALEQDAFDRTLAFAEANPDNADAQLLFIDSILSAGEVPPARTEPLTESLDRLRDALGADSFTYNFAESRRLYSSPGTRTPEVARQEIISRLDPFVEGQQGSTAPVEVLHLTAKWWELLPNSLERRLGYLRRAQQTSPTAWGIYPDYIRALGESREWDEAARALASWSRQLRPSLGLRGERRDLAQIVANQFNRIAQQADDARSRDMQSLLWGIAVDDAAAIASATGDRADRLRYAQVLLAAPDNGVARLAAMNILGLDELATQRVDQSRPASLASGLAGADLTVAAAMQTAVSAITLDTPDQQTQQPITEDDLPVLAAAAQLIAENAAAARLTDSVASGSQLDFPATVRVAPEPQVARTVLASALGGASDEMNTRATGMFYAVAYQPDRWQAFSDEARSAMLAVAAIEDLTEAETRALVYPLSQLGEVETAIELQRIVAAADAQEGGLEIDGASRITDVVAIAEILREAGRTEDAYAALDALSDADRSSLNTSDAPLGAQALVALLELETGRSQTPVTTAFARRIINNPQEAFGSLQLAIERAANSQTRRTLLNLVSDELVAQSEGAAGNSNQREFRPAVASLWFTAATSAREDDPLRRELFTGAISRLAAVAAMDSDEARSFAYPRKAYCEIELGSIDAGIGTYRQALQLQPDDPATLNNLADALRRRGQIVEAAQVAERAVAASRGSQVPDSVVSIFYDTLGGSKLALGEVAAALIALQTSLDLDASNYAARVTLAEAQLEAGESADTARATIEPIGPAAEQDMSGRVRERLAALRERLNSPN